MMKCVPVGLLRFLRLFALLNMSLAPAYANKPLSSWWMEDATSRAVDASCKGSDKTLTSVTYSDQGEYSCHQAASITVSGITVASGESLALSVAAGDSGVIRLQPDFQVEADGTFTATTTTLPESITMQAIPGATFTMGNNVLQGPQADSATEHQVTLSSYSLSATEITNAEYVTFLNAAYTAGFVEVVTGTTGADLGLRLVVGTDLSDYAGKVLYNLDGTRVMKDHGNEDDDDNSFTGAIEPENPLNIAYIGYNSIAASPFYLKNPHEPADFDWYTLCDYQNYTSVPNTLDGVSQNDFANWPELTGWTASNPENAQSLPDLAAITAYPVTFIRWWGAKAFASFYAVELPTEAQWEYAAQAGQGYVYAVFDGATTSDANWNSQSLNPALHHVRAAQSGNANPFGLYNLGGNVWEWTADNYVAYAADAVTDPLIIASSTLRSWRGGSWNYHEATLEARARYYDEEDRGNDHFGFRIAK